MRGEERREQIRKDKKRDKGKGGRGEEETRRWNGREERGRVRRSVGNKRKRKNK